jgi:dTMP kinase
LQSSPHDLKYYGNGIPYRKDRQVRGRLVVIEGPDASGRSTQCQLLTAHLESGGHAVLNTGLKRSELISRGIVEAKQTRFMGKRTMALFYVADFADQLENKILPALEAGYIVLADRYIYTLIARNLVRRLERHWTEGILSFAVVPDRVFYLDVDPETQIDRVFHKGSTLDYYESGLDLGLSDDMLTSFIEYQRLLREKFRRLIDRYHLTVVNGNLPMDDVSARLIQGLDKIL